MVLVFGEDENDRESIKILLEALRPDLRHRVKPQRHPLVLIKNARLEDVPDRAQQIANVVDAYRVRAEIDRVFAHEDCDDVEPAHERVATKIEEALAKAGCEAVAVTPAWELEAWWFLWPSAVKAAKPSWREPNDYVGKSVGKIRNAKEELKKRVVPPDAKRRKGGFRGYQESDSPRIALRVQELGMINKPQAKSLSFDRFRRSAGAPGSASTEQASSDAASTDGPEEPAVAR